MNDWRKIHFDESISVIEGKPSKLKAITNKGEQIHCGGILFATGRKPFLQGLDLNSAGVKIVDNIALLEEEAKKLFGKTLVTHQTGPS